VREIYRWPPSIDMPTGALVPDGALDPGPTSIFCLHQLPAMPTMFACNTPSAPSAREQGSLNEVAIEALARGAGLTERRCGQRDLSDIAKTWRHDSAFDHALAAQDTIDQELWR